jgi:uncharacterized protein YecT (DUF1311 family)
MRTALLLLSLLLTIPRLAMAVDCVPDGSIIERNYCAALEAERAESELALALTAARTRGADDPNALEALTAADVAWQRFREAALAAAFPCYHDDLTVCFGLDTARQHALFRTRLARERIAHLATDWRAQ